MSEKAEKKVRKGIDKMTLMKRIVAGIVIGLMLIMTCGSVIFALLA